MRLCIIGGGLTGAVAAAGVRQRLPQAHIEILDKGRIFGGRMFTKRRPSEPKTCNIDVGAQYISNVPDYAHHLPEYQQLVSQGVLQPLSCTITDDRHPQGTLHYVAPQGMTRVVEHYIKQAACVAKTNTRVTSLSKSAGTKGWRVFTDSGEESTFDAVMLTVPVPQMLTVEGDLQSEIDSVDGLRSCLTNVRYSSRFCLGLFYSASEGAKLSLPEGVGASYLKGADHPFCYVAIDTVRRGVDPVSQGGVSVMLHTSRQFGAQNVEVDKEKMLPVLLDHFSKLMPHWPEPEEVFCHKWRYSQVVDAMPPEYAGSTSLAGGSIVLTGDAFTRSNVDGCLVAARSAVDKMVSHLQTIPTR